jgi:transposase
LLATLVAATVGDPSRFKRGRNFAAWLGDLQTRKPYKVTAIALANKTARMIWAVLSRGDASHPTAPRAA